MLQVSEGVSAVRTKDQYTTGNPGDNLKVSDSGHQYHFLYIESLAHLHAHVWCAS